jgi:hypothetical protein
MPTKTERCIRSLEGSPGLRRAAAMIRNFFLFGVLLTKVRAVEISQEQLRSRLDSALTRAQDRELFDLLPRPADGRSCSSHPKSTAMKAVTPARSRQNSCVRPP